MNRLLSRVSRFAFCQSRQTTFEHNCTLETNVEFLRKQLTWRASNLGMRELDLLVGSYAKQHLKNFTEAELLKFNQDVLVQETPTLNKYLLGQMEVPKDNKYIQVLIDYGTAKPKLTYF